MNYELAKELKDSGFPGNPQLDVLESWEEHEEVDFPTLSELIEACGKDFLMVGRHAHLREAGDPNRWFASGKITKAKWIKRYGSTPEEAVARLWLALNSKK